MSSFILPTDWDMQIRATVLAQVKNSENALTDAVNEAVVEAASYLRGKYITAKIFAPVITWNKNTAFAKDTRILFTADPFSNLLAYTEEELAVKDGFIYEANEDLLAGAWDASKWTKLVEDKKLFYVIVTNTTPNALPVDINQYAPGDTRYPILVMYCKDIALYHIHSNISPQNIPKLREDRYNAAIKWLDLVRKDQLEADLPLLDEEKPSGSFRFGGNEKYSSRW